jgi:uncharacterized Zn finger protein (UPF0148 family)
MITVCDCGRFLIARDGQHVCPLHGIPNNTRTVSLNSSKNNTTEDAEGLTE